MSDDLPMTVIIFGLPLESTPEGLFLMDHVRQRADAALADMEPWERDLLEDLRRKLDAKVLGGPA